MDDISHLKMTGIKEDAAADLDEFLDENIQLQPELWVKKNEDNVSFIDQS